MKRYSTALLLGLLTLTSQLAHADVIDDAIGNIQQAINDAYNPGSSRNDDDDDRRRQLEDRRQRLDERQRQLDDDRRRLEEDERRLEDDYDR
ncbi:hypothetical protein QCD57_004080 [Enterobacter hormaechei]|nr:hypothetical protein [Enterobacter hormaechei]